MVKTWNMARPLLTARPLPSHSQSPLEAPRALQHFKSLLRPLSSSPSKNEAESLVKSADNSS